MRPRIALLLLAALWLEPAPAQSSARWDDSGNGLLDGLYHFRHLTLTTADVAGNLARAVALHGTIELDGDGRYRLEASMVDSATGAEPRPYSFGAYRIAASGHGLIESPLIEGESIYGGRRWRRGGQQRRQRRQDLRRRPSGRRSRFGALHRRHRFAGVDPPPRPGRGDQRG